MGHEKFQETRRRDAASSRSSLIAAPVLSVPEVINHPQINSHDILQPVDLPGSGLMMLPRTPYHM